MVVLCSFGVLSPRPSFPPSLFVRIIYHNINDNNTQQPARIKALNALAHHLIHDIQMLVSFVEVLNVFCIFTPPFSSSLCTCAWLLAQRSMRTKSNNTTQYFYVCSQRSMVVCVVAAEQNSCSQDHEKVFEEDEAARRKDGGEGGRTPAYVHACPRSVSTQR